MTEEIFKFIPQELFFRRFLISLFVFLVGWVFAQIVGKTVKKILEKTQINQILKRIGTEAALVKIHPGLSISKFYGEFAKWFFVVLALMLSSEILGLSVFTKFLSEKIFTIFFNVFIASLIFIVAVFLSDLSQRILVASFEKEKIVYSRFLGKILSIAIWVLAILAILYQLQIASNLILIVFIGAVSFIVLSSAIAVGFGLKDLVIKFFKDFQEKLK